MSSASIDGGAESDQFMSLPGTPAADDDDDDDDDASFWKGESLHTLFLWLISETVPRLRFFPHTGARFRDVRPALYTQRSREW